MKKPKNAKAAKQAAPKGKPGRPKGSGKKAEAKAAPKAPKPDKVEAAKAAVGHNAADPKLRALFLDHLPKVERLRKRVASATGELRALYKDAKRDGFEKFQFDIGLQLADPEGEAAFKDKIRKQLQAASFIDTAYGTQLDMFGQPDRTPAVDRARDEGARASMTNSAAMPPYDPSTPQYKAYMDGFHAHQATLATFKTKEPDKPAKAEKPPKAAKAEKPAPAPEQASTVIPITRAAVLAAAQQPRGEVVGEVDADEDEDFSDDVEDTADDVASGGFARRQ